MRTEKGTKIRTVKERTLVIASSVDLNDDSQKQKGGNQMIKKVKKEINKYLDRLNALDESVEEDQKRADSWMLTVTAVGVLEKLVQIESQEDFNEKQDS